MTKCKATWRHFARSLLSHRLRPEEAKAIIAKWSLRNIPDSKVHGANMGPIRGRQDPVGPHVGSMNFAIWDGINFKSVRIYVSGYVWWMSQNTAEDQYVNICSDNGLVLSGNESLPGPRLFQINGAIWHHQDTWVNWTIITFVHGERDSDHWRSYKWSF